MKCLCFSDSHGYIGLMQRALRLHPDAEVVFFLGDGLSDVEYLMAANPNRAFIMVRGNCDPRSLSLSRGIKVTESVTLLGKKITLTHGHEYDAKFGTHNLLKLAEQTDSDLVLFGHTHTPCEKYFTLPSGKGVYLFNPGSASEGYSSAPSFGIITLTERDILLSHGVGV